MPSSKCTKVYLIVAFILAFSDLYIFLRTMKNQYTYMYNISDYLLT